MYKEQLLKEILEFSERKSKLFFTYEEFYIYLYYKYRKIFPFSSIARSLRRLAKQGFLIRRKVPSKEWGFCYRVEFYPVKYKIRLYLRKRQLAETKPLTP